MLRGNVIIKALNTFSGILDLSALERLQESNPCEKYPFRLYIRPGQVVEADDKFYSLTSIQNALRLGYIQIGNLSNLNVSLIDPSYSGTTVTQTAGEALVIGDVVYYKNDGKVYKAKADSTTTMICMGIATASCSINNSVVLLVDGMIRNSSVFNFTVGGQASSPNAIVYVSETTYGDVTQLRSITSGHIVQIIGYAVTTDVLNFKPDYTYIEIA
jgi:hypothetical protein